MMTSFIRDAFEEMGCQACGQASTGNPADPEKPGSATYAPTTDAKKDVLLMTGPLSESFTRALNVYFEKRDVLEGQSDETPAEQEKQAVVAAETQAMDEQLLEGMAEVLTQREIEQSFPANGVGSKFEFVHIDSAVPEKVDTDVYVSTAQNALKPEVVDQLQTRATNNQRTGLIVVMAKNEGETSGVRMTHQFIQLDPNGKATSPFNDASQLDLSAESLFEPYGIKVVYGVEGFIDYLNQRIKK